MCQGFSHFSGLLHHFVLTKLATSYIRVKNKKSGHYEELEFLPLWGRNTYLRKTIPNGHSHWALGTLDEMTVFGLPNNYVIGHHMYIVIALLTSA